MEKTTEISKENETFFSEAELAEILKSLSGDSKSEGLSEEEMDKVLAAWDKVERKKLFKQ